MSNPSALRFAPRASHILALAVALAGVVPLSADEHDDPARPADGRGEPYRVLLYVVQASPPGHMAAPAALLAEAASDLQSEVERCAGACWKCAVEVAPDSPARADLFVEHDSPRLVARRIDVAAWDKVFVVALSPTAAGPDLFVREWDVRTDDWGAVQRGWSPTPRDWTPGVLELLPKAFRPTAELEQASDGALYLKLKAGELRPADPDWAPVAPGALFEVLHPPPRSAASPRKMLRIPWTYVQVDEVQGGLARSTVQSGLKAPWGGRSPRPNLVALAVQRVAPATRVVLAVRAAHAQPMPGLAVHIRGPGGDVLREAVSDRRGEVLMPVDEVPELRWLTVDSGSLVLARVPLVPGAHATERLELASDNLRLSVEADVATLQADLLDTVARRTVLIATARNGGKTAEWTRVDAALAAIRELPGPDHFQAALHGIRVPATAAARKSKDRLTEKRINKLCEDTAELITRYLDPDKVRVVQEELAELRRIDTENKAEVKRLEESDAPGGPAPRGP